MERIAVFETVAQIAVTIAGFTGVVFALGERPADPHDPTRAAQLRNLLHVSLGATLFAFAPELCLAFTADEALGWRLSHGSFGAYHVIVWSLFVSKSRFSTAPRRGKLMLVSFFPLTLAIVVLHLVIACGGLPGMAFAVYLTALLWFVLIASIQFALLLDPE